MSLLRPSSPKPHAVFDDTVFLPPPPAVVLSPIQRIAKRFAITRPIVCFDLETTGTSTENDRIVELAYEMVMVDGTVNRYDTLLNPAMPIPPGATAVHGISDDDVADAPLFTEIATDLVTRFTGCDFLGYNVRRFDLPVLVAEFQRSGITWAPTTSIIDGMEIFYRKEPRDLEGAMRFYRCGDMSAAHQAAGDVTDTLKVIAAQLERYDDLPPNLTDLGIYCLNKPPNAITDDGKIAWLEGAARFTFGKNEGVAFQDLEPSYFRWILSKDFSAGVKAVCKAVLEGHYPEKPEGCP